MCKCVSVCLRPCIVLSLSPHFTFTYSILVQHETWNWSHPAVLKNTTDNTLQPFSFAIRFIYTVTLTHVVYTSLRPASPSHLSLLLCSNNPCTWSNDFRGTCGEQKQHYKVGRGVKGGGDVALADATHNARH